MEYPYQSVQINLTEPAAFTMVAWPDPGYRFVKWTKNGEDFSTEPQITVLLDENTDFVAVFEEDPGWQNPVMNFVGEYQCDRAHAKIEAYGPDEALITIEWADSAVEEVHRNIVGKLDTETLTIAYEGFTKSMMIYDDKGEAVSEVSEYEDGSGSIVFNEDGSFTWHEDQSDTDMVFEWAASALE